VEETSQQDTFFETPYAWCQVFYYSMGLVKFNAELPGYFTGIR